MQVQQSAFTSPQGSPNSAEPVQSALHSQSLFHSTLASAKATSSKTTFCSCALAVWDLIHYCAQTVLNWIFCRCWTNPELELDIDKALIDRDLFTDEGSLELKKKMFEAYPSQFKKEIYAFFNSISKKKIETPEQLFRHREFPYLFHIVFNKILYEKKRSILDRILGKIDGVTDNLILFQQSPHFVKMLLVDNFFPGFGKSFKKIDTISTMHKKYLTKANFKPLLEKARKDASEGLGNCKEEIEHLQKHYKQTGSLKKYHPLHMLH